MSLLVPVLEKTLIGYAHLDVVTNTRICLTDKGYIFVFNLRKMDGLFSLYVARERWPRTWRSLDSMVGWLSERGLLAASISLQVSEELEVDPPPPKGNPNDDPP
jgi:hypothetical protein